MNRRKRALLGASIFGLILVSAGAAIATKNWAVVTSDSNRLQPIFERNDDGQSFGSLSDAQIDEDAPDLIAAIGTNGIAGYIRSVDFLPATLPKSPKEALAMQGKAPNTRVFTLYDKDGKTIVGQYVSGNVADGETNVTK